MTDRIIPPEKYCPKCETIKPCSQWFKGSNKATGLGTYCKPCSIAYNRVHRSKPSVEARAKRKAYYLAHPEFRERAKQRARQQRLRWASDYQKTYRLRIRARHFLKRHPQVVGTIEEVMAFITAHPECAICKRPNDPQRPLHVEHCHTSHKIRGMVCSRCNSALGFFNDDIDLFHAAIDYLLKNKT